MTNGPRSDHRPGKTRLVFSAVVALATACSATPRQALATSQAPRVAAGELPSLERWRRHVTDDLMPFWLTADALGTPIGNFPTFRCVPRAALMCVAGSRTSGGGSLV